MSMSPYEAEIEEGWDRLYNELGPQYLQEPAKPIKRMFPPGNCS